MAVIDKIVSILGFPPTPVLCRSRSINQVYTLATQGEMDEVINQNLEQSFQSVTQLTADQKDYSVTSLVIDATQYHDTDSFHNLYACVHKILKKLATNARLVFVCKDISLCVTTEEATFCRSLSGFTKSLAKELGRKGTTVNLLYVSNKVSNELSAPLRFFLSDNSTFVSGQSLVVSYAAASNQPATKRMALVTGAAQGIGAAIAQSLAKSGYQVVGLDVRQASQKLNTLMDSIGGQTIIQDITAEDAGDNIANYCAKNGAFDLVVHNAGITRDRTLGRMSEQEWDLTLNINLLSVMRINQILLAENSINNGGSLVCLSSINGIAGQAGQTNYATTKAGLIGYVASMAPVLAEKNININAVAPGFIETEMTAKIPFFTREIGRRVNALSQAGLPEDIARSIVFLADADNKGISGQTLRVCGLNMIGA